MTNTIAEAAPLKSRKGTPRNADSFLKDEPPEPRRITLTPNILRDDSGSVSSLEKTRSTSFDSLEKDASPPKEAKEDKRKKEKKQGMLSGLFKSKKKDDKKDKKGRDLIEIVTTESDKASSETARQGSPQSSSPTLEKNPPLAERKGKLQKNQPAAINTNLVNPVARESPTLQSAPQLRSQQLQAQLQSPMQTVAPPPTQNLTRSPLQQQLTPQPLRPAQQPREEQPPLREEPPTQFYAELEGSQVAYEAPTGQEEHIRDIQSRQSNRSPEPPQSSSSAAISAITNILRPSSNSDEPKRQKVKKAKTRVELDDFDEVEEEDEDDQRDGDRLSESPVEITHNTFMHGTEAIHIPMNMDEEHEVSTRGERTPEERVSEEGARSSSPSMLDVPTGGDSPDHFKQSHHVPGDFSENASDFTDDDPTPVPSKSQSPLQHVGMPKLKQTPTPPPALVAPFPPTARSRPQSRDLSRSTPDHVNRPVPRREDSTSSTTSTSAQTHPSPSPSTASTASNATADSFSNASLRAWMDGEGNDIRDMLVVIHDKSNVTPVPNDHPLMRGLWDEERDTCGRMMGELDNMLSGWLNKKKDSASRSASRNESRAINGSSAAPGTAGVGVVGA